MIDDPFLFFCSLPLLVRCFVCILLSSIPFIFEHVSLGLLSHACCQSWTVVSVATFFFHAQNATLCFVTATAASSYALNSLSGFHVILVL